MALASILYQRKKGRDLFDLWLLLERKLIDPEKAVNCFCRYMEHAGTSVSRAQFEANLAEKAADNGFRNDIRPLLATDLDYAPEAGFEVVGRELAARLPGHAWQGLREKEQRAAGPWPGSPPPPSSHLDLAEDAP